MYKTYTISLEGYGTVTGTLEELEKMVDALVAVSSSYGNKVSYYIERRAEFLRTYYWSRYDEATNAWYKLIDFIRATKEEVTE